MNELKEQYDQALAFGESYCINDWIKIKNPKISDIIRFGEKKYYQLAYAFTATPSDYKHQLFDIGRDYEEVDDYELFIMLFADLRFSDNHIIFDGLDTTKMMRTLDTETNMIIFRDPESGAIIDRTIYYQISDYISYMLGIKKNYEKAANAYTKRVLIEESRENARLALKKPYEPRLRHLALALSDTQEFKHNYFEALDLPISLFMEHLKQVQKQKNYTNLMHGIYSGKIDTSKLTKKQLNWTEA